MRNRALEEASWARRLIGAVPQHAFSPVAYEAPLARGCHQPQLTQPPGVLLFSLFPLLPFGHFPNFFVLFSESRMGKVPLRLPPVLSR